MTLKETAKFVIKITISTVIVYLIFRIIGVRKIYEEVYNAKGYFIAMSVLLASLLILLKSIRWKTVVEVFKIKLELKDSVVFTLISSAFSLVTPSKLGEFVKVKYLTDKTGLNYLKSFLTVIGDKLFDIIAMGLFALLGISFLPRFIQWRELFIAAFFMYLTFLVLIFLFLERVKNIVRSFLPFKFKEGFKKLKITRKVYAKSLAVSLGIWMVLSIQAFLILTALNAEVSLFATISAVPLMALSSFIPLSLGGIGIREIIAISFFSLMGINAEKSAVFSLLYTFSSAGIPAVFGIVLYFFFKKH